MRGWAIHLLAAIALIICGGTFALWWRSYRTADYVRYTSQTTEIHNAFHFIRKLRFEVGIRSDMGAIVLAKRFGAKLERWHPNYPDESPSNNFEYGSDESEFERSYFERWVQALNNAPIPDPPWLPYGIDRVGTGSIVVRVPTLGLTGLPGLIYLVLAWKIVRRRKNNPNACRKCGYLLTGNTSGICPECGTPAEKIKPSESPSTSSPQLAL